MDIVDFNNEYYCDNIIVDVIELSLVINETNDNNDATTITKNIGLQCQRLSLIIRTMWYRGS